MVSGGAGVGVETGEFGGSGFGSVASGGSGVFSGVVAGGGGGGGAGADGGANTPAILLPTILYPDSAVGNAKECVS